jgi:ribosomal-protein-serine acetyltransferase
MICSHVNQRIQLRLISRHDSGKLFTLIDSNREYLRCWHPWVDNVRSPDDIGRMISAWEEQNANNRGFCTGILFDGQLCGAIHHLNVDWLNRWTALSYWLDATHQGRGIMTIACRALIIHAFKTWKLNRVTIECAAENTRSRAIPERLGFKLEGIIRGIEKLHDHYADHAIYGLLRSECQFMTDENSNTNHNRDTALALA